MVTSPPSILEGRPSAIVTLILRAQGREECCHSHLHPSSRRKVGGGHGLCLPFSS